MKRLLLSALAVVALGCLVFGNSEVNKSASTFPPEPVGITYIYK